MFNVPVLRKPVCNPYPKKGRCVVHFGKDFWIILKILKFIINAFSEWGKTENEDTPDGKE